MESLGILCIFKIRAWILFVAILIALIWVLNIFMAVAVVVSVDSGVSSTKFRRAYWSLHTNVLVVIGVNPVSQCWTLAILIQVWILEWGCRCLENIFGEETTFVDVNLLLNLYSILAHEVVVHARHLAHESSLLTTVVLVLILNI